MVHSLFTSVFWYAFASNCKATPSDDLKRIAFAALCGHIFTNWKESLNNHMCEKMPLWPIHFTMTPWLRLHRQPNSNHFSLTSQISSFTNNWAKDQNWAALVNAAHIPCIVQYRDCDVYVCMCLHVSIYIVITSSAIRRVVSKKNM